MIFNKMTSTKNILDLDKCISINELAYVDSKNMSSTLYQIIDLVKKFGRYMGIMYRDIGQFLQYQLDIKYLDNKIPIIFEFDNGVQFINIMYCNNNQDKTYLKLYLSISDEPTIKYIENDHSGFVPNFNDGKRILKPGEYLVHFSHSFFHFIGFKRVRLDDDSHLIRIDSEGREIRTKLWLYSLLTKGKSWYSKFGYAPGNSSMEEINNFVGDVRDIKLGDVKKELVDVMNNYTDFDDNLTKLSRALVDLIGESTENLIEYTINHSIEEFTKLTNHLFQSVFGKKYYLFHVSNSNEVVVEFHWYELYNKLFVANVMQVNNDITHHYFVL